MNDIEGCWTMTDEELNEHAERLAEIIFDICGIIEEATDLAARVNAYLWRRRLEEKTGISI